MTNEKQLPLPRNNNGALVRDMRRRLRLALNTLDALIGKIEIIEKDLALIESSLSLDAGWIHKSGEDPVAYNLDIHSHPDGSVEVAIDSGDKFTLGPRLAEIFQFIASCDKEYNGNDGLVGWSSREEIKDYLSKFASKQLRISYVNNLVHLLREKLYKAGYDRNLIQTHRQKGVRLAMKRSARGVHGAASVAWL
jgi:hypothetical protein